MQFVNAALQRPTLHVTTAPTLGRSCDSLSLTTDTTGSCRARHEGQHRAQLVHRITSRTPSESDSPWQPSLQGGCAAWAHSAEPWEEQPCRGRAHLVVLILSFQTARQRREDEAMTSVGAVASRGLLRAAEPLTCDTGA